MSTAPTGYLALATDYDGTLAQNGHVDQATVQALERFKATGRALVLATGRVVEELKTVFPRLDLFDRVVAENGAVIYRPGDGSETLLGDRPTEAFIEGLKKRGVGPIAVGQVVVATWEPHQEAVVETIRDLGLDLRVICNKRAIMILPSALNKAVGLAKVLGELDIHARDVVGVGDAENDRDFLDVCGLSVAVANALLDLKATADLVTQAGHGAGVTELIDALIAGTLPPRRSRPTVADAFGAS